MFRIWTIRFALALIALTGTWLIQEFAFAQMPGSAQERFLASTPKEAAQAGTNFLNQQFSTETVIRDGFRQKPPPSKAPIPKGILPDPLRHKKSDSKEQKGTVPLSEKEAADVNARMVNEADKYAQKLGFASAAEAARAKLGVTSAAEAARAGVKETSLRVKFVRAKELKNFKVKDDPNLLLEDTYIEIFPIYAQKEGAEKRVRSSITVTQVLHKNENKWHWIERGSPELMKKYDEYKHLNPDKLVKLTIRSNQATFLRFFGVGTGENLKLIPIYNVTLFEEGLDLVRLKQGEPKAAGEIFAQLAPYAAKILAGQKVDTGKRLLR